MRLKIAPNPKYPAVADAHQPWLEHLAALAAAIGPEERWVELSFIDDADTRAVNREYRGIDEPTDVLSFHYGSDTDGLAGAEADPEGEILVSVETASRQAEAEQRPLAEELAVLVIHGLFHILGHDHEGDEEAAAMAAAEAPFRQELRRYFASPGERS